MTQILFGLIRQFQQWEPTAQIGFGLASLMMIPFAIVARTGPEGIRLPATVGVIVLVIVSQGIFMWANRGMVTTLGRAQRDYRNGDFEAAVGVLESLRNDENADYRVLTLLGNTYRQLGQLEESEAVLYEAVNISPDHYFPHYGFGRTLLIGGHYQEAISHFEQALEYAAPSGVRFDLGEALYRYGDFASALEQFRLVQGVKNIEDYRLLMAVYVLCKAQESAPPDSDLIESGLPYWKNVARLYADTLYGEAVLRDIESITALNREG